MVGGGVEDVWFVVTAADGNGWEARRRNYTGHDRSQRTARTRGDGMFESAGVRWRSE